MSHRLRFSRPLTLVLLACLVAPLGCAWSRPKLAITPAATGDPVVLGTQGLLAAGESQQAVEDAVAQARYRARAESLVKAVQNATGAPLIAGNRSRLLMDGPRTYAAMFDAVRAARHHVHVETYIFDDGQTGQRFGELLASKRREGVAVRVIYDAVGSLASDEEFFANLRAQGVEVAAFRPLHPATLWRVNNRDHRKLLVVDGRIAFTGGINISETYSSGSGSRPGPEEGKERGWRDTQIEVRGPIVKSLQSIFMETWKRLGQNVVPSPDLFPDIPRQGEELMQVMASDGGDSNEFRIYDAYRTAILLARERIWVTQGYFAPDEALRQALADAVKRGVDVRVIVPAFTDSGLIFHASRATYAQLLAAGIRLFEYQNALLHSKTAVVDGIWSTVGSFNLDPRSFAHNNELNVAVVGHDFAVDMEAMFRRDLKGTREITAQEWAKRSYTDRLKEFLSSLFSYWL